MPTAAKRVLGLRGYRLRNPSERNPSINFVPCQKKM